MLAKFFESPFFWISNSCLHRFIFSCRMFTLIYLEIYVGPALNTWQSISSDTNKYLNTRRVLKSSKPSFISELKILSDKLHKQHDALKVERKLKWVQVSWRILFRIINRVIDRELVENKTIIFWLNYKYKLSKEFSIHPILGQKKFCHISKDCIFIIFRYFLFIIILGNMITRTLLSIFSFHHKMAQFLWKSLPLRVAIIFSTRVGTYLILNKLIKNVHKIFMCTVIVMAIKKIVLNKSAFKLFRITVKYMII